MSYLSLSCHPPHSVTFSFSRSRNDFLPVTVAMKTTLVLLVNLWWLASAMRYPNEIEEAPTVICEKNQIVVKIKTTSSNPSLIYVDDFGADPACSTRNRNSIEIKHGKCGMSMERTEEPLGAVQRVCVSVQLHPMFVTEADRSYCVQCVYVEQHVLNNFEQALDVSEATATELAPQFDFQSVPKCSYSIRKDSPTGPPAHYAVIGESVFHVWQCDGGNHGILVQNCYVEDGQGNRILIVDQDGCGVDSYVMDTPEYSEDLNSAFQVLALETHVFKFAQKTVARFACQIRICVQGEDCHKLAPPKTCPSSSQRESVAIEKPVNKEKNNAEDKTAYKMLGATTSHGESLTPNSTIGTVFFGGDLRARRDVRTPYHTAVVRRSPDGYPEMDVVGEIRVLDSPQDVQYYERSLQKGGSSEIACISGLMYTVLVSSLVFLSLLLLVVVLILIVRNNNYRKRIVHFAS